LETIYAFFSKYKSNYVETGVNLTGYKSWKSKWFF
jgi:hypothetical protein